VDGRGIFPMTVNHFTNHAGYNAIRAQPVWKFLADNPPADHPRGAYFTTLAADTPNLSNRLRIPRVKLQYFFSFQDAGDLTPIDGDRGRWIFYSPNDYEVAEARKQDSGRTNL